MLFLSYFTVSTGTTVRVTPLYRSPSGWGSRSQCRCWRCLLGGCGWRWSSWGWGEVFQILGSHVYLVRHSLCHPKVDYFVAKWEVYTVLHVNSSHEWKNYCSFLYIMILECWLIYFNNYVDCHSCFRRMDDETKVAIGNIVRGRLRKLGKMTWVDNICAWVGIVWCMCCL